MSGNAPVDGTSSAQACEDASRVHTLLRELGIVEFDPRIVEQIMDITYQTATEMLQAARAVSQHCAKPSIDAMDVRIAADFLGYNKNEGPTREQIIQIANTTNAQPLPPIKHSFGLKLPNDRFCLLQNNVQWRMDNPVPMQPTPYLPPTDNAPQLRPDQVHNFLKRKAPADDFD